MGIYRTLVTIQLKKLPIRNSRTRISATKSLVRLDQHIYLTKRKSKKKLISIEDVSSVFNVNISNMVSRVQNPGESRERERA